MCRVCVRMHLHTWAYVNARDILTSFIALYIFFDDTKSLMEPGTVLMRVAGH